MFKVRYSGVQNLLLIGVCGPSIFVKISTTKYHVKIDLLDHLKAKAYCLAYWLKLLPALKAIKQNSKFSEDFITIRKYNILDIIIERARHMCLRFSVVWWVLWFYRWHYYFLKIIIERTRCTCLRFLWFWWVLMGIFDENLDYKIPRKYRCTRSFKSKSILPCLLIDTFTCTQSN